MRPVPVGAKADRPGAVTRRRVEDAEKGGRPGDPTDNLCGPVTGSVGKGYSPCY